MPRTRWIFIAIFLAAVLVRVIAIDQAFVDRWSWRQSDVAAIARNYFTGGYRFAYPQINWAGDQPGYVGTEFPMLPFGAAVSYKLFGVHEWIGRSESVICFAIALPFFYLLVAELLGQPVALWAIFFYSFAPLSIATSRSFMPDMLSLSLAIIGSYLFLRWLRSAQMALLFISAATISLSILIKAPTAIIGLPLLVLIFATVDQRPRLDKLLLFAAITLLPAAAWYWHADRIASQFYPHHFFGAGGFEVKSWSWYWRIARLTAVSSLTLPLTALCVGGLFVRPRGHGAKFFAAWAVAMFAFIILAGYGNRHQWYQLPLVPIASAFGALAMARIAQRFGMTVASAFVLLFAAFAFLETRPFFEATAAQLRELGLQLKETTPRDALIVAADDGDPTIFYYAERKGWHFLEKGGVFDGNPLDDAQLIGDLEQLRARGARYLVFPFGTVWWLDYYHEFDSHLASISRTVARTNRSAIFELAPVNSR